MHFNFSSLLTIAAAATAVLAQPSKRSAKLNPPVAAIHQVDWATLPPAPTEATTNAKRFAQGLPPLNPRRRNPNRGVHHGVAHAKGTRVITAPRSETSPAPPTSIKCNILVKNADSGEALGYVSSQWNSFAEYGPLQETQDADALEIESNYSSDSPKQLNFIAINGKSSAYPYFGASVGFASTDENVGEDDPDYLLLTGNTQTPPGSTPSYEASNSFSETSSIPVASESAIWSYDSATGALTAWWVNTDGTSVNPHILWSNQANNSLFTLTGSPATFREAYGVDGPEVTFTCVPPVAPPV
ncbi:unnamed protein product [Rhizoctonia solani]|uniref:Uncharacterized protein n=1 Tax=Rhizoctonia solani TaxID=456999 RepID=A0A8H3ASU6_9AGAM|nr:unnamed protein product [Rhizoctonia solani]